MVFHTECIKACYGLGGKPYGLSLGDGATQYSHNPVRVMDNVVAESQIVEQAKIIAELQAQLANRK